MPATVNGFVINIATDPKPWGPRDEEYQRAIIPTVVADTIDGAARAGGHRHGRVYDGLGKKTFDSHNITNVVTVGACDDFTGSKKVINNVIGKVDSSYKVLDTSALEFLSIEGGHGAFSLKTDVGDGVSVDTVTRLMTIGALIAENDEYDDSASVVVKTGHFTHESFVVEDVLSGAKSIIIDNTDNEIDVGGQNYTVNIGAIGGSDVNIGRTIGNPIQNRVLTESGAAYRIVEHTELVDNTILLVDTRSADEYRKVQLGTGMNTFPLTLNKIGKVFTRDTFTVDHLIYGMSSTTINVVKLVTIGGQSFLHVDIDGTKDTASDLFISLPFACDFGLTDGKKIGVATGINNVTEVVASISYFQNNAIPGCDLHILPLGSSWTSEQRCAVSFVIPFAIANPEFTNEIPS